MFSNVDQRRTERPQGSESGKPKRVELNNEDLEQVSGGTFYDAACSSCTQIVGGWGLFDDLNEAQAKVDKYNSIGCPRCSAIGTMYVKSAESITELFS